MTFMVSWLLAGALLHFLINVTFAHRHMAGIKDTVGRRVVVVGATLIMLPTWGILLALMSLMEFLDGESFSDILANYGDNVNGLMDDIEYAWNGH